MKHAYLIMADANFEQLKKLVKTLDDKRNDIYIHIDKKRKINLDELNITTQFSKLYFIPQRVVNWGGVSFIRCELDLFSYAYQNGNYEFYHLISGKDLPLQSQDTIHAFFKQHKGKLFIEIENTEPLEIKTRTRQEYYHLFPEFSVRRFSNNIFLKLALILFRKIEFGIQHIFNINYSKKTGIDMLYKGSNWLSVDDEFVEYLLKNKELIEKQYKHSITCDELFIQTLVKNNVYFSKKLYEKNTNMRYIVWPGPKTWRISDLAELKKAQQAGYMFARKFDEKIDEKIIDEIIKTL